MDRPKRARKSTKDYGNFFYPTQKRKKRRNDESPPPRELMQQSPQNRSGRLHNSTQNRQSSPAPSPNRAVPAKTKKLKSPRIGNQTIQQTKARETQTDPKKRKLQTILNELYTNPEFPTAFGGQLKKFILSKDSISKHKQRRKIFKRRKIFVQGPYVGVQADTINYRNYARYNSGFRYILGWL